MASMPDGDDSAIVYEFGEFPSSNLGYYDFKRSEITNNAYNKRNKRDDTRRVLTNNSVA